MFGYPKLGSKYPLIILSSCQALLTRYCRHLRPNTLKVALFHGDRRAKTTEALLDHDVVLTTYRTLAFDWKGRRTLQGVRWFRAVLDEGTSRSSFMPTTLKMTS
jgi:SWI/SNF-related matrix-associated actin-dependent regulator of chromatin subfamily A3